MTIKRRKVSVIGAGFTGATAALMIAQKELADVVLVQKTGNESRRSCSDEF